MSEYIELDKVREVMSMFFTMSICASEDECRAMNRAIRIVDKRIESIPVADVVPLVHGRWKKVIEDDKYYHMECSMCCGRPLRSRWVDDAELSTFCPWCGTLMDKGGDA